MIQIRVLTREQCHWCEEAQAILERLAQDYDLSIERLDITTAEGEKLALDNGVLFPPGIFLGGEVFSYGRLSERKLRRELERRTRSIRSIHQNTSVNHPRRVSP